jgi:hypothetical protein
MDQLKPEGVEVIDKPHSAHNGKSVTKMATSPKSTCIVTYSQDDKSFVCWSNDNDNKSLKYDSSLSSEYFRSSMNFKVSDEKIVILNEGKLIFNDLFWSKKN